MMNGNFRNICNLFIFSLAKKFRDQIMFSRFSYLNFFKYQIKKVKAYLIMPDNFFNPKLEIIFLKSKFSKIKF